MDLFALKREFLEYCELDKGQSVLTISGYDRYLSKFLEWLQENQKEVEDEDQGEAELKNRAPKLQLLTPDMITQESIRQYRLYVNRLSDRYGKELKRSTQNYRILAVRAFLRYLAFRGISSLSPEKVSIAKTGDREITFLESSEMESVLQSPDLDSLAGLRDRSLLEILFSTGMRVSEIASLNVNDINFERGEIAILGKGKKLRVVFLSESALNAIDQYLKNRGSIVTKEGVVGGKEDPLFLSNKGTKLTVRSIERIVKKYSTKAGLTKKVSPHTLRHSFATDLLISGADIRSVQSLLGHSSITTTQVYTHVTDQHLREIHQKYHGKSLKNDQENIGQSEANEELEIK